MRQLSEREWQTLRDLADPSLCLVNDGEILEQLIADGLVDQLTNCYRPSPLGSEALRHYEAGRPTLRGSDETAQSGNGSQSSGLPPHAQHERRLQMDHANHPRLSREELTSDVLQGATVYGVGDEKVGSVSHVHGTGSSAQVVVDVGGFLGIGAKPVSVPASDLDFMRDEDGDVHAVTTWTKDQLKQMPEHHD